MTTATHINYYHLCHRKLWLFSNGIQMEQTSSLVAEGKFIHEIAYPQRAKQYKELDFGYVKIDHYDAQNKVIHEVKKSNKLEHAHIAQLKYYIYVLMQNGVEGVTGILEYPKLRKKKTVLLTKEDMVSVETWLEAVEQIIKLEDCPKVSRKPYCTSCAYFEYCFI